MGCARGRCRQPDLPGAGRWDQFAERPGAYRTIGATWLGSGDYSKEEWREALKEARRIHDEKETDYLIGTPLLADYLEEGLSQLGYSIEDFEIGRM